MPWKGITRLPRIAELRKFRSIARCPARGDVAAISPALFVPQPRLRGAFLYFSFFSTFCGKRERKKACKEIPGVVETSLVRA